MKQNEKRTENASIRTLSVSKPQFSNLCPTKMMSHLMRGEKLWVSMGESSELVAKRQLLWDRYECCSVVIQLLII